MQKIIQWMMAGTKYVVKPVLVYTKGGKQYKATITLNMQF